MKALLLIAHGSRRKQSNEEVVVLADKLKQNCAEQYNIIHAGFLELAETLIPDGIKRCVDDGDLDYRFALFSKLGSACGRRYSKHRRRNQT